MSLSCKEMSLSLLWEKCPDIAFRYAHKEGDSNAFWQKGSEPVITEELLAPYDVVFIYGLEGCLYAELLLSWLYGAKVRQLFFIESDMAQVDLFLEKEEAGALLSQSRVSFYFVDEGPQEIEALFEEIAPTLLSDRVQLLSMQESRSDETAALRLTLLRKVSFYHSLATETLHYHLLVKNVLPGIRRGASACYVNALIDSFYGTPVIICGAGPSLAHVMDELKKLSSTCLIIACGSAITALSNHGIEAHIHMAIDPNDEEYIRMRAAAPSQVPLFFAPRVNAKVFDVSTAPLGLMFTGTGGALESMLEEPLGHSGEPLGHRLSHEALSVTTMAIALAEYMGCSSIVLCGVDLSFTESRRYVEGVVESPCKAIEENRIKSLPSLDRVIKAPGVLKEDVSTLVRWKMEAQCLSRFAIDHPHIHMCRGTKAGLAIEGVKAKDLSDMNLSSLHPQQDIRGRVHYLMQQHTIEKTPLLQEAMQPLYASIIRIKTIVEDITEEIRSNMQNVADLSSSVISARQSVLEMDLQEEIAQEVLLGALIPLLDRILSQGLCEITDAIESRQQFLSKELIKWQRVAAVVESYLQLITS